MELAKLYKQEREGEMNGNGFQGRRNTILEQDELINMDAQDKMQFAQECE